jgi:hypothetical protein
MSVKTTGVVGAWAKHEPTIRKLITTCREKMPSEEVILMKFASGSTAQDLPDELTSRWFLGLDRTPGRNARFKTSLTTAAIDFINGKSPD